MVHVRGGMPTDTPPPVAVESWVLAVCMVDGYMVISF